jgi:hypothetical protein
LIQKQKLKEQPTRLCLEQMAFEILHNSTWHAQNFFPPSEHKASKLASKFNLLFFSSSLHATEPQLPDAGL